MLGPRGIPRPRRAICHWYRDRFGVHLDRDSEAIVAIGSKEGLAHLTPTPAGELSALEPGPPLELVLPDLEGRPVDLAAHKGKVALVNFWASWCTPCIEEMPSIERLADAKRGRPFVVVAVNVGEGELRAKAMVERLGLGLPVLLDKDSAVFEGWQATVLPTTYLLDAAGVPRYVGRGPLEWDGAEAGALVTRLLDAPAAPAGAETERSSAGDS